MKWVVASPRVGKVGAEYDIEGAAANGINVLGLIAGRFIVPNNESTQNKPKPSKVKKQPKE